MAKQNNLSQLSGLLPELSTAEAKVLNDALTFFERPFNLALTVHLNTHREKLDFTDKFYLVSLYQDICPEKVIQKSVQCGISEMLICWAFAYAEGGYAVLYVLPKFGLRNRFVKNRIDTVMQVVPEYRKLMREAVGDADSMSLKHFGKGVINFVGSNSPSEFIEFPADVVIFDELNRCDQANIALANDRMDASELKHTFKVGNPTHPDFGISAEYAESDQKEWHVKCGACNEYQSLSWLENVVSQTGENEYELRDTKVIDNTDISVFCRKCGQPIDRLSQDALWVAQSPSSLVSGYHISQLFGANTTIKELWQTFQDAQGDATKLQVFWNSKMGLSYVSKGANLDRLALDACRDEYLMQSKCAAYCSMGVDVGKVLHVRISSKTDDGKRRAEHIGIATSFNELSGLIARYNVRFTVIDMYPETHKVKEFQKANRHVVLSRFAGNETVSAKGFDVKDWEGVQVVVSDRTQMFDQLVASIGEGKLMLPKNAGLIDDYYKQMQAPVRIYDAVKDRYYWDEGSKSDHYFLSEVYDMLASHLVEANRLVVY